MGTAAAAVSGVAAAKAASPHPEKRDIQWARARVEEGHRVRLESWRVPLNERPPLPSDLHAAMMIRMGSPAGLANVDECAVTVEMLEGPWEIVPEEDHPKPPEPIQWSGTGGELTFTAGYGGNASFVLGAGK